ncbi:MAG: hypothetical protein ACRD2B_10350 [Terriglobia bacterium]
MEISGHQRATDYNQCIGINKRVMGDAPKLSPVAVGEELAVDWRDYLTDEPTVLISSGAP